MGMESAMVRMTAEVVDKTDQRESLVQPESKGAFTGDLVGEG